MPVSYLAFSTVVIAIFLATLRSRKNKHNNPLPPGPKGYPVVGNIFDIPKQYEQMRFAEWFGKYGEIVHFKAFDQSFVILNTQEAALDLLETRSGNYSSRPRGTMLFELMGCAWMFTFRDYDTSCKKGRKVMLSSFSPQSVKAYWHVQEKKMLDLLRQLLTADETGLEKLTQFYVSSVILAVIYGYHIKDDKDEMDLLCQSAVATLVEMGNRTYLVDLLPILKYTPSWFPFANFKRDALKWRREMLEMRDKPFEYTQKCTTSEQSMISRNLNRLSAVPIEQLDGEMQVLKDSASVGYLAGMDTTKASIRSFCLAMILYPEIQKRAQAEVDVITGGPETRLPTFGDKNKLPYIQALISEVLRWHPVLTIGIPHRSVNDDVYKGYFIPAGTIVFANIKSILHDATEYPNPEVFNPDRFMPQSGKKPPMDPASVAFGFGRRICPGQYLALETIWITVVSLLATFDILPTLGKDGKTPIIPTTDYLPGIVAAHKEFPCRFVPRSERMVQLVSDPASELQME